MKEKLKKAAPLFSGAIISALILMLVFSLKEIWPFGSGNVTYNDMAQGSLPFYYHLYDWMHGEKALFWDWFSGLGVSVANSGTVTPIDFLIIFFKRDNIIYALGILLVARCMACAISAHWCFEKLFPKVDTLWKIMFSISYALSAYSMFYYTNLQWLDFVIVFPVLIYGLKRLLDDNKPALYIAAYAVSLFLSVYFGFMITLAVFFIGGLYALLIVKKEQRAQRVFLFGVSTLTGALLSCWRSFSTALQTVSSKRLETSFDATPNQNPLLTIMNSTKLGLSPQKFSLFFGLQFAGLLVLLLVIKLAKDKKRRGSVFVFGASFIMLSPAIFENANLIWHGGSYVSFPMRFAFASIFLVLCFALYFIDKYFSCITPTNKKGGQIFRGILLFVFSAAFLASLFFMVKIRGGTFDGKMLESVVILFCVVMLFGTGVPMFLICLTMKKSFIRAFCFIMCLVQAFSVAYSGISNTFLREKEKMLYNSESFVEYCQEVDAFDTDTGALGRVKNKDTSLNANYPFLIKAQALSNWTHNIPAYMQKAAFNLGYSKQYTRLLDSGGTAFTDGILGVKELIARSNVPVSPQYEKIDETKNFSLYNNLYSVDFGLLADKGLLTSITEANATSRFEIQNWLYKLFTGSDDELISFCGTDVDKSDSIIITEQTDDLIIFEYTAGKNEILYLNATDFGKQTMKVFVNNERVMAPYYKHTSYGYYPSQAVNGLLELGTFREGERVEVVAECLPGSSLDGKTIQLGSLKLNMLKQLGSMYSNVISNEKIDKSSLTFDYNNTTGNERYLFIPVSYDEGWSCTINGEDAVVYQALGAYLCVKLPSGTGSVEMHYTVRGLYAGIGLSLLGVIFALAIFLILKRKKAVPAFITKPIYWLFVAVYAAAVVFVYAIPIAFYIKSFARIVLNKLN